MRLKIITVIALLLGLISPAQPMASMAVIDATAVGKLTDQLSKLQQQIDQLTKMSATLQDQINAIGKAGQISLPILNIAKIGSRLRQDIQCLKPDFSRLMPDVNLADMQWNSICQGSAAYRDTLFINPDDLVGLPSWKDRRTALKKIEDRRRRILEDITSKGLAQGDTAARDVEHLNRAADDLEVSITGAATQNDRLAAIAQGQVIIARALAQQNQILATLLKVQSAFALQAGVRLSTDFVDKKNKDKGAVK